MAMASALLLDVKPNKKPAIKPNAPITQLYHFLKSMPTAMDVRPVTPYMQNKITMKVFILSSKRTDGMTLILLEGWKPIFLHDV